MDTQIMEEQTATAEKEFRRPEASEIITSGRISTAVWYLAWPTVINMLIQTAYNIINRIFLGHIGDQAPMALAAIGLAGMVLMTQFAFTVGLSTGASALVARFLGAKEYNDANEASRQSLILSVVIGVLTMIPLLVCPGWIASLIGAKGEVRSLTAGYMAIIALFSVPMFLHMTVVSILRSTGDVRSPLYAGALVVAINIVLDWLLIFGVGPIPAMGVNGAAVATGVSRVAGMLVMIGFLRKSVLRSSLHHFRPHFGWFWRILNIGWPATIQNLLWSTGFAAYIRILSYLPDAVYAQAALTVAISLESLCFMPGVAYSIAAAPLVGQNLGAKQPDRAQKCAWVATWQAAAVMTTVAVLLIAFPRQLALLFTDKEPVVALIVSYLRINAPSEPFLAIGMVLAGALQGAGDTRMPTWIEFIVNWVVRLPVAWWLAVTLGYHVTGAWLALCLTTVLYGFLIVIWFKRGHWKTVKV